MQLIPKSEKKRTLEENNLSENGKRTNLMEKSIISIYPEKWLPIYEKNSNCFFYLVEQPEESQRKAYKNENRYLLPNPLVIAQVKSTKFTESFPIENCDVSVRLVHQNGEELESSKQCKMLEGQKVKRMTASTPTGVDRRAEFSLKVKETSGRSKFRLLFTAHFTVNNIPCEQQILSNPFKVISNKKKAIYGRPKLTDLIPKRGFSNEETEVWIRGNFFCDRTMMNVKFGDKEASIIETEENLITCIAPIRTDLLSDTVVTVTVSSLHSTKGPLQCTKSIHFKYLCRNTQCKLDSSEDNSSMCQVNSSIQSFADHLNGLLFKNESLKPPNISMTMMALDTPPIIESNFSFSHPSIANLSSENFSKFEHMPTAPTPEDLFECYFEKSRNDPLDPFFSRTF